MFRPHKNAEGDDTLIIENVQITYVKAKKGKKAKKKVDQDYLNIKVHGNPDDSYRILKQINIPIGNKHPLLFAYNIAMGIFSLVGERLKASKAKP